MPVWNIELHFTEEKLVIFIGSACIGNYFGLFAAYASAVSPVYFSGPKHIGVNKTCRPWPAVTSSCTSVGSAGPGFDYLLGSCLHATSLPFDRGGGDVWPQLHPASGELLGFPPPLRPSCGVALI
jgi:hypothetical protein